MLMSLFSDLIPEILVKLKDLSYFCRTLHSMAKKQALKSLKKGEEITSLTKEELQKMKFKLSIEIPKEDFDELLKAMMGVDENKPKEDSQL